MPRWTIYRTVGGKLLRHGHVAVAADLGTVQGDETAIQDTTVFASNRRYAWDGDSFEDAGAIEQDDHMRPMRENPRVGWPITVPADIAVDTNDSEMLVRRHDDVVEEGVAFEDLVPPGMNFLRLVRETRPETAPGAAEVTKWNLRGMTVSATGAGTWSSAVQILDVAIVTDENLIKTTELIPLASINLTPGQVGMLLLTRDATDVGDTLPGDATTLDPMIGFL